MASEFRGIDLIVGYGPPINQNDMYFNFHFLMNKYEWDEKVQFTNLLKLKYSVDYEKTHFAPTPSSSPSLLLFFEFHQRFSEEFNEKFVSKYLQLVSEADVVAQKETHYLKETLANLEKWLLYMLNHLLEFSMEVRNFCLQFFFTSTVSQACFRLLLKTKDQLDELMEELHAVKTVILEKATSEDSKEGSRPPSATVQNPKYMSINSTKDSNLGVQYETIAIPANESSAPIATEDGKLLLKAQVLSIQSPLAAKLDLLKASSNGNPLPPSPSRSSSPPPSSSSRPNLPPMDSTSSIKSNNHSEIDFLIELIQQTGIDCIYYARSEEEFAESTSASKKTSSSSRAKSKKNNFKNEETDQQTNWMSCPAKLFIQNYFSGEINKNNMNSQSQYHPETCVLEFEINSNQLQLNHKITLNVLTEIEEIVLSSSENTDGNHGGIAMEKNNDTNSNIFRCRFVNHSKPDLIFAVPDMKQFINSRTSLAGTPGKPPSLQQILKTLNYMIQEVKVYEKEQRYSLLTSSKQGSLSVSPSSPGKPRELTPQITVSGKFFPSSRQSSSSLPSPLDKQSSAQNTTFPATGEVKATGKENNISSSSTSVRTNTSMSTGKFSLARSKTAVSQTIKEMQKDPNCVVITNYFWVKQLENRWFKITGSRLLIFRSDRMIEIFKIPPAYSEKKMKNVKIAQENKELFQRKLDQMKRNKYDQNILLEAGFLFEVGNRNLT
jgi:hypothetical protein